MPPLRFRTAGFPQYGSKTAERISLPMRPSPSSGLTPHKCSLDYTVVYSRWPNGMSGRPSPLLSTPLPHGSLAPPGLCCPLASSLLRPDPPVSGSPHASSLRLVRVALRARDLPCFGPSTILLVPPPIRRDMHQLLSSVSSLVHTGLRPFSGGSALSTIPQLDSRG